MEFCILLKNPFIHKKGDNMLFSFKRENSIDISLNDLEKIQRINPKCILLDVRSTQEYKEGHLNNAINIPLYSLKEKNELSFIEKNSLIIVYCQSGTRSKRAIKILNKKGYNNLYNLKGGLDEIQ